MLQAQRFVRPNAAVSCAKASRYTAGATIFQSKIPHVRDFEYLCGMKLLQLGVFIIKLPEAFGLANVHDAEIGPPVVDRCRTV